MLKRQQAFEIKRKLLKGALHCHTTRSDGQKEPANAMKIYKDNGYDFMAITDHRLYNMVNPAPELGVTLIPGVEIDNDLHCDHGIRCYHTVCLGPTKEDGNGMEHDYFCTPVMLDTPEDYQPILDKMHEKNNLTILCHPEWSGTSAKYFEMHTGNVAMEIYNTGSARGNNMDKNAAYWDELLGQGKIIWGVAADDSHSPGSTCGSWVMVNSENNVNAILDALKAGEFYSSCGPEIYDFYVEDGKAVIECSPVAAICLQSDAQPTRITRGENGLITRAEFGLGWWVGPYAYVRMTVIDENGNYAWTNPIFLR